MQHLINVNWKQRLNIWTVRETLMTLKSEKFLRETMNFFSKFPNSLWHLRGGGLAKVKLFSKSCIRWNMFCDFLNIAQGPTGKHILTKYLSLLCSYNSVYKKKKLIFKITFLSKLPILSSFLIKSFNLNTLNESIWLGLDNFNAEVYANWNVLFWYVGVGVYYLSFWGVMFCCG